MHKRPLDNSPYQGSGGYHGRNADIKRSRPEMGGGGGGGGNSLSMYGETHHVTAWPVPCRVNSTPSRLTRM